MRVDPGRAPRGTAWPQRDEGHEPDHRGEGERIAGADAEQDAAESRRGRSVASASARPRPSTSPRATWVEPCRSTMPRMRRAVGAQRHADAELLRPLAHRERHHAVDADRGEHHRHDAEDREHRRDDAVRRDEAVEVLLRRVRRSRAAGSDPPCCTSRRSAFASASARWPPRGFTITVANWLDERLRRRGPGRVRVERDVEAASRRRSGC